MQSGQDSTQSGIPVDPDRSTLSAGTESGFVAHARVVAGLTFLSRIMGLVRDAVCSRTFGAGPVWSAFALAFLVPNLFRRLFGEGALSAAFLPEYARLTEQDQDAARKFAGFILGGVVTFLGVITLVGEAVLWYLLSTMRETANVVHSGALFESRRLVVQLLMVMLPYMPLICLVALLGAMLQVHRKFGPTAAAPIILNIFMIAGAVATALKSGVDYHIDDQEWPHGIMFVAIGVVTAGVVQVVWSLIAMNHASRRSYSLDGLADAETRRRSRKMVRLLLPMLVGLGALQLNTLLDGLIASYPVWAGPKIGELDYPLDVKSNSILFFSQRLYQFPLGVFGIAVATAIFPALARTAANREDFTATLRHGLRLTMFIGLPASLGLMIVRVPLATVILRGNHFTEGDVERVANVLLGYAPAIWAYSLNQVLTRGFYANDDSKTPVRIALGAMILNLILNVTLIWVIGEAGLAWSTSISAVVQSALLLIMIRRYAGRVVDGEMKNSVGMILAGTMVMGLLSQVSMYGASMMIHSEGWWERLILLGVGAGIGAVSYIICAKVFGMDEWGWVRRGRSGETDEVKGDSR